MGEAMWKQLEAENVGYSLVGAEARATVPTGTGETVTIGPVEGVRVEERINRHRLPDLETGVRPTFTAVEVCIQGKWFYSVQVEVKEDTGTKFDARAHFKPGGVTASCESIADQVEAAVERVLRRQQSKGQHPSNGVA